MDITNGTRTGTLTLDTPIPGTGLNAVDTISVLTNAGYLSVACLTWLVYDFCANLRQEVTYVWLSRWSMTKVVYLLNRFLAPILAVAQVVLLLFNQNLDGSRCNGLGRFVEVAHFILTLIQGVVLTMRVWYIWTHRRPVQLLVLASFVAALIVSIVLTVHDTGADDVAETKAELETVMLTLEDTDPFYKTVHTIYCFQGSTNSGSVTHEWPLYLVLLIMQTFLFALTILRAVSPANGRSIHQAPVITRLVRDGSIFFVIAFVCLVFDMVTSAVDQPKVELPFYFANFTGLALSVCIAHLILSIRSLAARLSNEPCFLLNDAEMTRLQHLHGLREGVEGEVSVDIASSESDARGGSSKRHDLRITDMLPVMTRVGAGVVFDTRSPQSPMSPGYRFVVEEGSNST